MRSFQSSIVLLWSTALGGVRGWGPYTHAGCGTLYYQNHTTTHKSTAGTTKKILRGSQQTEASIINNTASNRIMLEAVFVTANSFPDAFKYTRDWMHTFEYAAFQVERAAVWSYNQNNVHTNKTAVDGQDDDASFLGWNSSMEFIHTDVTKAFSYGYLLHLLEDYVGHHTGGYLNPKKDHRLEFDVDTLFYLNHKDDTPPWFYRDNGMAIIQSNDDVRREIVSFVSDTSQH